MGGKQQGIPNGWKLFRIQHHPAEPGATPWGDGQTLNRRTGSLLWVSSHVHCSPLFQSWEEVSSYASHWLVKSNRIWRKIRWGNVNIKLFSNAIYQHHKQTNKPKKKVQNKKFLSLYSLSDYSLPVPWAGLSLCPLECLLKARSPHNCVASAMYHRLINSLVCRDFLAFSCLMVLTELQSAWQSFLQALLTLPVLWC